MRIWVYDLFIFHTYSVGIDPIISALLGSNYYLDILLHNNNNNNGNNNIHKTQQQQQQQSLSQTTS